MTATKDLRGLVGLGLLRQHGTSGAAYYTLARVPTLRGRPRRRLDDREHAILEHVRRTGRITNAEARDLVGMTDVFAIVPTGPPIAGQRPLHIDVAQGKALEMDASSD